MDTITIEANIRTFFFFLREVHGWKWVLKGENFNEPSQQFTVYSRRNLDMPIKLFFWKIGHYAEF